MTTPEERAEALLGRFDWSYGNHGPPDFDADAIAAEIRSAERAAREGMRERCAKVCDRMADTVSGHPHYLVYYAAAASIRALPTEGDDG